MDSIYYLGVFKKAYRYFSDARKFDDKAINYLKWLFARNAKESSKAIKLLEKQIGNDDYPSPYGKIFYRIMEDMISSYYYDYNDLM